MEHEPRAHRGAMLTTEQVAHAAGIHTRTVLREIERGRLRARRFGPRSYRVAADDLAPWLTLRAASSPDHMRARTGIAGVMTVRDAAEQAGVSIARVRYDIQRGRLRATRSGGYIALDPVDVATWAARLHAAATA